MDQEAEAIRLHRIPHAAQHLGQEGVCEDAIRALAQDEANGGRAATDERTGCGVGVVVELVGYFEDAMARPIDVDRMTGYALGFFFFWLVTAIASSISVYLMRTAHRDLRIDEVKD